MKSLYYILLILYALTLLSSCNKKECKECYLIEENNGTINEVPIGTFCDEKIEEKENQVWVPSSGSAHNECR